MTARISTRTVSSCCATLTSGPGQCSLRIDHVAFIILSYLLSTTAHRVRLSVSCSLLSNQLPIVDYIRQPSTRAAQYWAWPEVVRDCRKITMAMPHRIYVLWKSVHYIFSIISPDPPESSCPICVPLHLIACSFCIALLSKALHYYLLHGLRVSGFHRSHI